MAYQFAITNTPSHPVSEGDELHELLNEETAGRINEKIISSKLKDINVSGFFPFLQT
jgi:hypothetical protein